MRVLEAQPLPHVIEAALHGQGGAGEDDRAPSLVQPLAQRLVHPQGGGRHQRQAFAAVQLQPDDPLRVIQLDGCGQAVARVLDLLGQRSHLGHDQLQSLP